MPSPSTTSQKAHSPFYSSTAKPEAKSKTSVPTPPTTNQENRMPFYEPTAKSKAKLKARSKTYVPTPLTTTEKPRLPFYEPTARPAAKPTKAKVSTQPFIAKNWKPGTTISTPQQHGPPIAEVYRPLPVKPAAKAPMSFAQRYAADNELLTQLETLARRLQHANHGKNDPNLSALLKDVKTYRHFVNLKQLIGSHDRAILEQTLKDLQAAEKKKREEFARRQKEKAAREADRHAEAKRKAAEYAEKKKQRQEAVLRFEKEKAERIRLRDAEKVQKILAKVGAEKEEDEAAEKVEAALKLFQNGFTAARNSSFQSEDAKKIELETEGRDAVEDDGNLFMSEGEHEHGDEGYDSEGEYEDDDNPYYEGVREQIREEQQKDIKVVAKHESGSDTTVEAAPAEVTTHGPISSSESKSEDEIRTLTTPKGSVSKTCPSQIIMPGLASPNSVEKYSAFTYGLAASSENNDKHLDSSLAGCKRSFAEITVPEDFKYAPSTLNIKTKTQDEGNATKKRKQHRATGDQRPYWIYSVAAVQISSTNDQDDVPKRKHIATTTDREEAYEFLLNDIADCAVSGEDGTNVVSIVTRDGTQREYTIGKELRFSGNIIVDHDFGTKLYTVGCEVKVRVSELDAAQAALTAQGSHGSKAPIIPLQKIQKKPKIPNTFFRDSEDEFEEDSDDEFYAPPTSADAAKHSRHTLVAATEPVHRELTTVFSDLDSANKAASRVWLQCIHANLQPNKSDIDASIIEEEERSQLAYVEDLQETQERFRKRGPARRSTKPMMKRAGNLKAEVTGSNTPALAQQDPLAFTKPIPDGEVETVSVWVRERPVEGAGN